jgi:hypothetical protein
LRGLCVLRGGVETRATHGCLGAKHEHAVVVRGGDGTRVIKMCVGHVWRELAGRRVGRAGGGFNGGRDHPLRGLGGKGEGCCGTWWRKAQVWCVALLAHPIPSSCKDKHQAGSRMALLTQKLDKSGGLENAPLTSAFGSDGPLSSPP